MVNFWPFFYNAKPKFAANVVIYTYLVHTSILFDILFFTLYERYNMIKITSNIFSKIKYCTVLCLTVGSQNS